MLKIRLARTGKRGHATFRIVATEHTRPPKSGALAQIGSYDPHANTVRIDADRLREYLAHGAQLSPTVQNLLIEHKVLEGTKVVAWRPKKKVAAPGAGEQTPAAAAPAVEKPPETAPANAAQPALAS